MNDEPIQVGQIWRWDANPSSLRTVEAVFPGRDCEQVVYFARCAVGMASEHLRRFYSLVKAVS